MSESPKSFPLQGYREVEHTADWELEVWAADLPGLIEQATRGMYALSGTRLELDGQITRTINISAIDSESILVGFLQEVLFLGEMESLGFDKFVFTLQPEGLSAVLTGGQIRSLDKEIKAVTYHNLKIEKTQRGLEAHIVFDV